MPEPVYFSRVDFRKRSWIEPDHGGVLSLDLETGQLLFQRFGFKRRMPAVVRGRRDTFDGVEHCFEFNLPAVIMRNGKTGFRPVLLPTEVFEKELVFSYHCSLGKSALEDILPYCNAWDFVPFKDRTMDMSDPGYAGYRDELNMDFVGVTGSCLPLIKLPMRYCYRDEYMWPSERLYRHLMKNYVEKIQDLKGHITEYGGGSLFY